MSFILENEKLIQLLTTAGASHLNKYGQANTSPEAVMNANLAKKLLVNLQRTIDPNNAPKKVMLGMQGQVPGTPIGLTTEYLKSLGDLLNWAATNKITWNGKRFAWSDVEKKSDTGNTLGIPEDAGMFDVKGVKRERNSENRQPVHHLMWVSKQSLIDFLSFLRDTEEASKNKVFQVMIGKLITQANDSLEENEQISKEPKKKPGTGPNEIPDDTLLTTFPALLNMKEFSKDGDKQLKYGDIKSDDTIINWVKRNGINLAEEKTQVASNDPKFNYCVVLNVLYAKASYLLRNQSATPELKARYTAFVNQLVKVGPTMQSPDGKACTVGSGTQPGQQPAQPSGPGGPATPQQIHSVVQYMPLVLDSINFQRISAFFRAYEQLLSATQNSTQWTALQGYKTAFNEAYNEVKNLTLTPMDVFPLYGGPKQVYLWLKPPQNDRYVPFIQKLEVALEAAKNAIQLFYSSYAQARSSEDRAIFTFTPEEKEIVESQILGYSIYQQNLKALARWENAQNEIAGIVRK